MSIIQRLFGWRSAQLETSVSPKPVWPKVVQVPVSISSLYDEPLCLSDHCFHIRSPRKADETFYIDWITQRAELANQPRENENAERFLAVAYDGVGGEYWASIMDSENRVFYFDHETGSLTPLEMTLREFFAAEHCYNDPDVDEV